MKKYITIIIVSILAMCALSCQNASGDKSAAKSSEKKNAVVERKSIKLQVESTGRIVSNLDVQIKCKASGEVITLPFDISDKVKKDDLVAELDPADEERNVQKANVTLSASVARLAKAKLNLTIAQDDLVNAQARAEVDHNTAVTRSRDAHAKADRVQQLYDQKLASQEEYETAETAAQKAEADLTNATIRLEELKTDEAALELKRQDLRLAESDVESARINLSTIEQRLTDTKVYAPIDGIVTGRQVQIGQIISSGISNVGGGTTILTLSDLSRLFVLAYVDESDIGRIEQGQAVNVSADAFIGKQFKGVVDRIAQKGINQSNVITFEVRIELLSKNKSLLKPEMTADVEILMAEVQDALTIPIGAVSREEGKPTVSVIKDDGSTEIRNVEVGITDGEIIEIVRGLQEGETVAINEMEYESAWRKRFEERTKNRPAGAGGMGRH
ncbi:efflux RND transporter periplasmic adaptor subunit [bacterium]|nr:efflux RND transporter periplasmic adaptor subunit [bacterium]